MDVFAQSHRVFGIKRNDWQNIHGSHCFMEPFFTLFRFSKPPSGAIGDSFFRARILGESGALSAHRTPTGFIPAAQGWPAPAGLPWGIVPHAGSTPSGLCHSAARIARANDATPLGLRFLPRTTRGRPAARSNPGLRNEPLWGSLAGAISLHPDARGVGRLEVGGEERSRGRKGNPLEPIPLDR